MNLLRLLLIADLIQVTAITACQYTKIPANDAQEFDFAPEEDIHGLKSTIPEFSFGLNIYETSPIFWPKDSIGEVIDKVLSCNNKTLRFFLPTLGENPLVWQRDWEAETFEFIRLASDKAVPNIIIVVGYGLSYHISNDLAELLPIKRDEYIEAIHDAVLLQVSYVRSLIASSNICWQIENELDIAHYQTTRAGHGSQIWGDKSFIHRLLQRLRDAVQEGWGSGNEGTCILVTYTPLSFGSRDVYPWDDSEWAAAIDFIGLHYYPLVSAFSVEWIELVRENVLTMIRRFQRPVMITETGIQAMEQGLLVLTPASDIIAWIRAMTTMASSFREDGWPFLGLLYFKFNDANAASEDACGTQGYMGFFGNGGDWFGHHEKLFQSDAECIGPWACWCEELALY